MTSAERLDLIEEYVAKNSYASINALAKEFNISTSTVRRNLTKLSEDKAVKLVSGGAVIADGNRHSSIFEQPYYEKRQSNAEEKKRIARAAANMIPPKSNIFLYSSSTVYEMLEYLEGKENLMITTNDTMIACSLSQAPNASVLLVGGQLRPGFFTTMGHYGEAMLSELVFDIAFVGIDAISADAGVTITNVEEASIKRQVFLSAKKSVAVCDHTKFEKASFVKVCNAESIDTILTGHELSDEVVQAYTEIGANVMRV